MQFIKLLLNTYMVGRIVVVVFLGHPPRRFFVAIVSFLAAGKRSSSWSSFLSTSLSEAISFSGSIFNSHDEFDVLKIVVTVFSSQETSILNGMSFSSSICGSGATSKENQVDCCISVDTVQKV